MFISAVDSTIVNVALPKISTELDARFGELQWVIDAFLVSLAGALLLGSGLADRFGRKRIFLLGFAGFALTSLLAAASQSAPELIGARVLMGITAACVLPPALSLIAVMFPPEERPRALAVWATAAGVGLAVGPVLGGVLVKSVGWQAVFLVNVPVALAALPVGLRALPESKRPGTPALDLVGVGLSIVALAAVVFTLIEGGSAGWGSPAVLVAAVVAVAAGAAFVRVELRRAEPLFDVAALARPRVLAGVASILGIYIAFLGVLFLLPQYLQYVRHDSVEVTGLALAPIGIGTLVAAPFNARVLGALGARITIAGGLLALAVSTALLLGLHRTTSVALVMVSMGLFGAFVPLTIAPATAVIMDDLGEEKAGDGGAINQLARQVGGAFGVAVIGSVFAAVYASKALTALPGFSQAARDQASKSIEEAQEVIAGTAPGVHAHLLVQISHAFDVAARVGVGVAVGLLVVAAVVAAIGLRASARGSG